MSPASAPGSASSRSRVWLKDHSSRKLVDDDRLKSRDLFDAEWIDFQGNRRSWSKTDSGQSADEDEKLRSKDLLDTEWIDFQHTAEEPPEAPRRVYQKIKMTFVDLRK